MRLLLFFITSLILSSLIAQESTIISYSDAKKLFADEKYVAVENALSPFEKMSDFSANYTLLLADARHKQKKYDLAIAGYTNVLKSDEKNYSAYFNRGAARVFVEDYKNALKDIEKAIDLNPDSAEMYYYRGYCEAELFDYKDAIESYSKAIELKPDYAAAYYNRGAAKGELDQYDAGMSDFNVALEKNPNLEDGLLNIGLSKLGLGNLDGAIADFDEVISMRDSNLGKAYFYRGEAKYNKGLKDAACDDFNRAMNLNYKGADINISSLCGNKKKSKRREIDITF